MNPTSLLRALAVAAVSVALAGTPEFTCAQRGGFHGGGGGFHGRGFGGHASGGFHGGSSGGFHGGGGFGTFHGSGGSGGFRSQGFTSFHNRGFGGFHGRRGFGGFGGYPYFYGFDFGFWPYWGAYPYWYGYGPWWGPYSYYSPYDYPDYPYDAPLDRYPRDDRRDRDNRCHRDYRHPDDGCTDSSPDTSKPSSENPPSKPSNTVGPERSSDRNYVTANFADYGTVISNDRATQMKIATATDVASRQSANSVELPSEMRPAVRNAIEALRAMPPDARARQLNSGRYDAFSPEEREFLNSASQPLQAE